MVRPASVDSNGMKKGAWTEEEDNKLRAYVLRYGHWNWRLLPKYAGLARCGKSCRLRWVNYLKPGVKRGKFTKEEEELITELHSQLGNKWSVMATKLPGRTDNEIKNFYHTRIEKKENKMHDQVNETSSSSSKNQEPTSQATNSFDQIHESSLSDPNTQSEVDFLPDLFKLDTTDYTHIGDTFPSLMEESNFFYPDLHHYSELSSSGSSGLSWIRDDEHSNMSSEFATSWWPSATTESSSCNYQHEEISRQDVIMGGFYDPLFDNSFDYGMDLFS